MEEHFEGLELQNEIHDYRQDQVYIEVNKVASMAEREEADARLVGDYNMKVGMIRKNVRLERER